MLEHYTLGIWRAQTSLQGHHCRLSPIVQSYLGVGVAGFGIVLRVGNSTFELNSCTVVPLHPTYRDPSSPQPTLKVKSR